MVVGGVGQNREKKGSGSDSKDKKKGVTQLQSERTDRWDKDKKVKCLLAGKKSSASLARKKVRSKSLPDTPQQ